MPEKRDQNRPYFPYHWGGRDADPEVWVVWDRVRADLALGQQLSGTVARVPRLGAIGIFIDLGVPIAGFVDVLLLPFDAGSWPAEGTVTDFLVWWMDPKIAQIRLVPAESRFRREDFDTWCLTNAPTGDPGVLESFRFDA
ncbi:hypothetical protein [Nocardia sp. NPDC003963]